MTSASQIERNLHHQNRKARERNEKDIHINSNQQERLPEFRDVRGKLDKEKVHKTERQGKKELQDLTRSTERTARQPGVVPIRFPVSFWANSPSETFMAWLAMMNLSGGVS